MLAAGNFWIDATILDKRKARPHLRDERGLYKMAWYLRFREYVASHLRRDDRLFVMASSLGTKKALEPFIRLSRRCAPAVPVRVSPRSLSGRRQRSVPTGGRLRHLGYPAEVGVQRPAISPADRPQTAERVRRLARAATPTATERPAPAEVARPSRMKRGTFGAEPWGSCRRTRAGQVLPVKLVQLCTSPRRDRLATRRLPLRLASGRVRSGLVPALGQLQAHPTPSRPQPRRRPASSASWAGRSRASRRPRCRPRRG